MAKENDDNFHNSESGEDIYDLYNACNGAVFEGLLDVRKLNSLSPEEQKILDLCRLKEIWAHTASGCSKCKRIVETLNEARMCKTDLIGARVI